MCRNSNGPQSFSMNLSIPTNNDSDIQEIRLVSPKTTSSGRVVLVRYLTALEAYDATSGAMIWRLDGTDARFKQGPLVGMFSELIDMPRATSGVCCAINNSSSVNNTARLLVLDPRTGEVRGDAKLASLPYIKPGRSYVVSNNCTVIVAFDDVRGVAMAFSLITPKGDSGLGALFAQERRCNLEGPVHHTDINASFTPDDSHLITCSRPSLSSWSESAIKEHDRILINVYTAKGEAVRCLDVPGQEGTRFRKLTSRFHFPQPDKWLVTCSMSGIPRVRIFDAMTGASLAVVSAELSKAASKSLGLVTRRRSDNDSGQELLPPGTERHSDIWSFGSEGCIRVQHEVTPELTAKGKERLIVTRLPGIMSLVKGKSSETKQEDSSVEVRKDFQGEVLPTGVLTAEVDESGRTVHVRFIEA